VAERISTLNAVIVLMHRFVEWSTT